MIVNIIYIKNIFLLKLCVDTHFLVCLYNIVINDMKIRREQTWETIFLAVTRNFGDFH